MGAQDRPYWRSEQPPAGLAASSKRWNVTTWLIVACVALFVVDGFLPRQWVVVESKLKPGLSVEDQRMILDGTIPTVAGPVSANPGQNAQTEQPVFAQLQSGAQDLVAVNTLQSMPFLQKWLYFSTSTALYSSIPGVGVNALQVWRFIGFQFCHAGMEHLVFNMLGLFFFGPIVERYLGGKRFLAFYLLCGVAGAFLYLLLNFGGFMVSAATNGRVTVPGLLVNDPDMPLVGASAGVFGVIIAAARLVPDATVLLFFVIPMRLKTLAYGLVLVAVASVLLRWRNAGGEAAHIGGAIAGWWFIHHPEQLRGLFDFLGRADPTSSHFGKRRELHSSAGSSMPSAQEVDRILDKVKAQGLASLNESERRTLRDATRNIGH